MRHGHYNGHGVPMSSPVNWTHDMKIHQFRTIDMEFSKAGRDCVYRGQNLLVQPALGKYVREWPEMPPSPGSRYFLHGEEFTRYLEMSFAASDELQSHALHDYLWQMTARMIRWLERVYSLHGCKTSHVRATARWIDGEQTVFGGFRPGCHRTTDIPPNPAVATCFVVPLHSAYSNF